jgi:hypothetical protein
MCSIDRRPAAHHRVLAAGRRRGSPAVDVGPGERLLARAGDDHRADCLVALQVENGAPQLVERLRVQRVQTSAG